MSTQPATPSQPSGDSAAAAPLPELETLLTEQGEPDDSELVSRARSGDTAAYDQLVTRYRGRIFAAVFHMTGHLEDARDLTQDAFIRAWRALPRFEDRAKFSTWLHTIALNAVRDWARQRRIRPGTEFNDELAAAPEAAACTVPRLQARPDHALQHRELGSRINEALQQLSPEHRAVVLLKEIEGLSYQEIAQTVGCAIGTVMSRLFNARKRLQEMLSDLAPAGARPQPA